MARMLNSGLSAHGPRRYVKRSAPQGLAPAQGSARLEVDAGTGPHAPGPQATAEDVPTKAADVLEWVGDDTARAELALDVEMSRSEKDRRKTLVTALSDMVMAS